VNLAYDRVTQFLEYLHGLSAPERIKFRLAVLVFRCRSHTAPTYLTFTGSLTTTADNVCDRQPPTSWSCHVDDTAPSATKKVNLIVNRLNRKHVKH